MRKRRYSPRKGNRLHEQRRRREMIREETREVERRNNKSKIKTLKKKGRIKEMSLFRRGLQAGGSNKSGGSRTR